MRLPTVAMGLAFLLLYDFVYTGANVDLLRLCLCWRRRLLYMRREVPRRMCSSAGLAVYVGVHGTQLAVPPFINLNSPWLQLEVRHPVANIRR